MMLLKAHRCQLRFQQAHSLGNHSARVDVPAVFSSGHASSAPRTRCTFVPGSLCDQGNRWGKLSVFVSLLQQTDYSQHPAEGETSARVPFVGLIVLLIGAMASILAYRVAETSGGNTRIAVAPVPPPAPSATVNNRPGVRRIDTLLVGAETQVTILLDRLIPYDAHRLDHPDRAYVDLHGASATPELSGKTLFVNSGGISTIRLAQTQPDTVRLVLDLDKRFDYSVSQQANPPKLVVRLSPAPSAKPKRKSANPKANKPAQHTEPI